MKYNLLIIFGILIMIKLTAAIAPCNKLKAYVTSLSRYRGSNKLCKYGDYYKECVSTLDYRHHAYYTCVVCTTPLCRYTKYDCGAKSSTKELRWFMDVFEAGFYISTTSRHGLIRIVLNHQIYHKIVLFYEREKRKMTITLRECKKSNGRIECIENRSEVHENLDPYYSCIFVLIGYQSASKINFVTTHSCSRIASDHISDENAYSLKNPIENFKRRNLKLITIEFGFDRENIYDGVPIILPCYSGGYFYYKRNYPPCEYIFPESSINQGLGYYRRIYDENITFSQFISVYDDTRKEITPSYFDENGMRVRDLQLKLERELDEDLKPWQFRNGCRIENVPEETLPPKIEVTETVKLNILDLITTTVKNQQLNLTCPTVEKLQPNSTNSTDLFGIKGPLFQNNSKVTLTPQP